MEQRATETENEETPTGVGLWTRRNPGGESQDGSFQTFGILGRLAREVFVGCAHPRDCPMNGLSELREYNTFGHMNYREKLV